MRKKCMLFIALLLIVLLAACSSGEDKESESSDVDVNKEGFPIVDEEITLTMMAPGTGIEEWEDMEVLQDYAEKTNINFEFDTPPVDDFGTNLNLAFSSGDIADIIFGAGTDDLTPGMEVDYGEQGMLLPLEDLIEEYAPNIQKLLEDRPDVKKSITTDDGHIYALPSVSIETTSIWETGPLWYNGDWLEALDVDELPKTTDEFYELLKRFKEEDPNGNGEADEIPLIDVGLDSSRPWLLAAFGLKDQGIEEVDGEVRFTPILPEYKEYLEYMNKLYEEGLLDPETFSQSDEEKRAKGQDNRVGVFPDWYSFFTTDETKEEAMKHPMFHPLVTDESKEPIIPRDTGIERGAFALSSENPNPEASIRWVDYFYSQEGWEYINMGPEGYVWEWDEDGEKKVDLDPPEGYDDLEDYRSTITPDFGITTPTLRAPIEDKDISDFDEFIAEETEEKIDPYAEVAYPLVYFTKEEQKEINTIEVDLESYVEQMEAKFITGVEPFSKWDEYVETIKSMNVDKYVEIHQEAYDRWAEN